MAPLISFLHFIHSSMGLSKVLMESTSIRDTERIVIMTGKMVDPRTWRMVNLGKMVNFHRPLSHSHLQCCSGSSLLVGWILRTHSFTYMLGETVMLFLIKKKISVPLLPFEALYWLASWMCHCIDLVSSNLTVFSIYLMLIVYAVKLNVCLFCGWQLAAMRSWLMEGKCCISFL